MIEKSLHKAHAIMLLCVAVLVALTACAATSVSEGSGGVNADSQRDKPTLILISIDGFRWDYLNDYPTPTFDALAKNGVKADALLPVFPTLTFPNHYSIATGLYPSKHGIVGNNFPSRDRQRFYSLRDSQSVQDGSWYGGEPIWVATERAGMVTAAFFFVGTEAPINGIPMTYWNRFNALVPGTARINQALEWLSMPAATRPHLITLYFEDVDAVTHKFGPGSAESIAAIKTVDGYLQRLMEGLPHTPDADNTYVVVVSDHGQSSFLEDEAPFILDSVVDLDDVLVVDHGTAAFLYLDGEKKDRAESLRDAINAEWTNGRAMLPDGAPDAWHVDPNSRMADVLVQADPGYAVFSTLERSNHSSKGDHGWAPEFEDMHGIFLATGPRLPKGRRLPAIRAVDVYPLLMEILGLEIEDSIDGDEALLPGLLRSKQ